MALIETISMCVLIILSPPTLPVPRIYLLPPREYFFLPFLVFFLLASLFLATPDNLFSYFWAIDILAFCCPMIVSNKSLPISCAFRLFSSWRTMPLARDEQMDRPMSFDHLHPGPNRAAMARQAL